MEIREGQYDVGVIAGPGLSTWPTVGVRSIARLGAEVGLTVGCIGGPTIQAKGVIPFRGSGGILLAEDVQKRIHRIQCRAIVKFSSPSFFNFPFQGWRSEAVIPLSTAETLLQLGQEFFRYGTAIIGTGNRALDFGAKLLESELTRSVTCIEMKDAWGKSPISGWEVYARRFEALGGKIHHGLPTMLSQAETGKYLLRIKDVIGTFVLPVSRVVVAGPFEDSDGVREYPPGSFLYEIEQSSLSTRAQDVMGWDQERERARQVAVKIVKGLVTQLGSAKERIDRTARIAKQRMKSNLHYREEPHLWKYEGKFLSRDQQMVFKSFPGIPQNRHQATKIASLECFEDISCTLCQEACPEEAIKIRRKTEDDPSFLIESKCTGCGVCVAVCPAGAVSLIHEPETMNPSTVTLPWNGLAPLKSGENVIVRNRRGEKLGSTRILNVETKLDRKLVELQMPTHLTWQARSIEKYAMGAITDPEFLSLLQTEKTEQSKVEIQLDGAVRLVPPQLLVAEALFDLNLNRSGDTMLCSDGSCGLCELWVDGEKRLACQTEIRKGMVVKRAVIKDSNSLCTCEGIEWNEVVARIREGGLTSPDAILAVTRVGSGQCHGQLCMGAFRELLSREGIQAKDWIDWRFPWVDWLIGINK